MQFHLIAPAFLILAIALSAPRFLSIFDAGTHPATATAPLTMIACAVCLSAAAMAFAGNGPWVGTLVVTPGLLLAVAMRGSKPVLAISMSAISLAAYLHLGLVAV
ncbi:hypothetical protein [Rhizobium sp. RAF56]|jgi:hypothetical protein|uniref:hypothetical protein n=1 Tax=Rhizobium sp. RAF56 TaxID=3233062 RepID=UPI003F9C2A2C